MRIALLGAPFVPVPPTAYGGTELVVDMQQRYLAALGHDVILMAPPGSVPASGVSFIPNCEAPLYDNPNIKTNDDRMRANLAVTRVMIDTQVEMHKVSPIDAVINHNGWFPYASDLPGRLGTAAVVTVLHNSPIEQEDGSYKRYVKEGLANGQHFVFISHGQRKLAESHGFPVGDSPVIHHGIDIEVFSFNNKPDDFLIQLGRIHPSKGIDKAIRVARQSGQRLFIGAKLHCVPEDQAYYTDKVEPNLDRIVKPGEADADFDAFVDELLASDKQIVWLGELSMMQKSILLRRAKAMLMPMQWAEPFGLVMIEALACGTPVLATNYPYSSASDIIEHGKTGFLSTSDEEMINQIDDLSQLRRTDCRRAVETRFDPKVMSQKYVSELQRLGC